MRRPRPRAGWWLLAAGALAEMAASVLYTVLYGFTADVRVSDLVPASAAAVAPVLTGVGLAVLSRLTPRGGPADVLDSLMIALGAFLVLWAVVIDPTFDVGPVATLSTSCSPSVNCSSSPPG